MTEKQYRDYVKLKKEIEPLEDFLFWCGDKYHGALVGNYPIWLIKKRFYIGRKSTGGENMKKSVFVEEEEAIREWNRRAGNEIQSKF